MPYPSLFLLLLLPIKKTKRKQKARETQTSSYHIFLFLFFFFFFSEGHISISFFFLFLFLHSFVLLCHFTLLTLSFDDIKFLYASLSAVQNFENGKDRVRIQHNKAIPAFDSLIITTQISVWSIHNFEARTSILMSAIWWNPSNDREEEDTSYIVYSSWIDDGIWNKTSLWCCCRQFKDYYYGCYGSEAAAQMDTRASWTICDCSRATGRIRK